MTGAEHMVGQRQMLHAFRGPAPEPPPGALVVGKARGTAFLLQLQLRHLPATCARTRLPKTRGEELAARRGGAWGCPLWGRSHGAEAKRLGQQELYPGEGEARAEVPGAWRGRRAPQLSLTA